MITLLQSLARHILGSVQRALSAGFPGELNPLKHLGALTIFFCWIVLISGIWLFIFFRTSVNGAFESVHYLMEQQWYLGGIMRSLHRYASDAAVVTIFIHIVREFSRDTYRLNRWFTWVAGMPLVWMIFLLGITGYWLVWDELALYVAITSAELIDAIPIFTDKMAANFLIDEALSDRFFTLMAFLHLVGLPIFLVFGIWLHVFRISRPSINPPRQLMIGTLVALLVTAALFPAPLQPKADLATAAQTVQLDWFYLHLYPLVQKFTPQIVWGILLGISGLLVIAPWLPPAAKPAPATVDLQNCNGCQRCADDCPYSAVFMVPRSDGSRYEFEAEVDPDLCVSCGICVGACPTATPFRKRSELVPGIDLPDLPMRNLKRDINDACTPPVPLLAFACSGSDQMAWLRKHNKTVVEVSCMGQIPPSFLDYILSGNLSDRILLAGCADGCRQRFGQQWTAQRIRRERDPNLRRRVGAHRIYMSWEQPETSLADIVSRLETGSAEEVS